MALGAVPLLLGAALRPATASANSGPGVAASPVAATTAPAAGWQWRSVRVGRSSVSYAAALPSDFRSGERRNVLLAFPPGGQTRDLVDVGMRAYWAAEGTRRGWVVISPAAPGGRLFFQGSAPLIEPFEAAALRDLGVVADRVALGGISNGGLSAFGAAIARPAHFVALVTLPGAPPGRRNPEAVASLKAMRIGLWVGGDDASWLSESRFVYSTLAGMSSVKTDIALHVVEGQGHILRGVPPSDVWDVIAPPAR